MQCFQVDGCYLFNTGAFVNTPPQQLETGLGHNIDIQ